MPLTSSFSRVADSVVHVIAFNGRMATSFGTGSVFDCGKKVLTCAHCIVPGAEIGVVDRNDPKKALRGTVIFEDAARDIAVLEFQEIVGTPVAFASSSSCRVGNGAFVVGFPMGIQERTLLSAHIASLPSGAIRIDASINQGNSGGPLFNLQGEQIGVVNAKHGNLPRVLDDIETAQPGGSISLGGIDPVKAIQKLIGEMRRNLNLGIGYAIPTEVIRVLQPDLGRCIPLP